MYSRFSLEGYGALVIGGSRSYGRALAHVFAEHGARLAIACSSVADAASGLPDAGTETAQECSGRGARVVVLDQDMAEPDAGDRLAARALAALEQIDIVAFCIGARTAMPFATLDAAEIQRQVAIHVVATTQVLQATVPAMVSRGWGRVVCVAPPVAARPDTDRLAVLAARAAQRRLLLSLAPALAADGVTANVLIPGPVDSDASPAGRAVLPADLAGAAALLCADAGAAISGAELPVTLAARC